MRLNPPFRPATPDDAQALAELVDFASEGLALYLWTKFAGSAGDPTFRELLGADEAQAAERFSEYCLAFAGA